MRHRFLERLRTHWWVWVAIAVAVVILNELFDREVAGDAKGHPGGDLLVAIVVLLIVAGVWDLVAARRSRPPL